MLTHQTESIQFVPADSFYEPSPVTAWPQPKGLGRIIGLIFFLLTLLVIGIVLLLAQNQSARRASGTNRVVPAASPTPTPPVTATPTPLSEVAPGANAAVAETSAPATTPIAASSTETTAVEPTVLAAVEPAAQAQLTEPSASTPPAPVRTADAAPAQQPAAPTRPAAALTPVASTPPPPATNSVPPATSPAPTTTTKPAPTTSTTAPSFTRNGSQISGTGPATIPLDFNATDYVAMRTVLLSDGFVTVSLTTGGTSPVVVQSGARLDPANPRQDLPLNPSSKVPTTLLVAADPASTWQVTFLKITDVERFDGQMAGDGPNVFVYSGEGGTFTAVSQGAGPFVIDAIGANGRGGTVLSSTGPTEATLRMPNSSPVLLAVHATGTWTISPNG